MARQKTLDGAQVRNRILEAAERLFAQRGVGAVSLREIATAAGQGNNAAVQYHFGSKDALLQTIFRSHLDVLDQRRSDMLDQAEAEGRLLDARFLVDILCLPVLDQVDESGRHVYAGFLAHYLLAHSAAGSFEDVIDVWRDYPALRRTFDLLIKRLAYVPPAIAQARIESGSLSFYHLLVRTDSTDQCRNDSSFFAALIEDALETITTGLCAPYRHQEGNSQ